MRVTLRQVISSFDWTIDAMLQAGCDTKVCATHKDGTKYEKWHKSSYVTSILRGY